MFNVIFSLICDLRGTRVVEKRGLARQQHVSDMETPQATKQSSSNQVAKYRLWCCWCGLSSRAAAAIV